MVAVVVTVLGLSHAAHAQDRIALRTEVTQYGDNTEFFNPFSEGDTLLGAAATVAVDVDVNDAVTFSGGFFMNHRAGSDRIAETWRPVLTLTLQGRHHRFLIGTLDTFNRSFGFGPDRTGPHGLLPPLQRETLLFERPYESGVQWTTAHPRFRQDAWLNWQQVNTRKERERFDVGANGLGRVADNLPLSVAYQFHLVHEGGQRFSSGPIRDSWVVGPGLVFEPTIGFLDRTAFEGYALFSSYTPDRSRPSDEEHGHGVLLRASGEREDWRGHLIFWAACDWIKEEGDPNYGSLLEDGTRFTNTRHYGEIGLARIFRPADGVEVEGSARLHRVEKNYEYSLRILSRVEIGFPVWMRK